MVVFAIGRFAPEPPPPPLYLPASYLWNMQAIPKSSANHTRKSPLQCMCYLCSKMTEPPHPPSVIIIIITPEPVVIKIFHYWSTGINSKYFSCRLKLPAQTKWAKRIKEISVIYTVVQVYILAPTQHTVTLPPQQPPPQQPPPAPAPIRWHTHTQSHKLIIWGFCWDN